MKRTAKELRYETKEVLEAVERGESVTITHHGKAKAVLVPVKRSRAKSGNPMFGMWEDDSRDPAHIVNDLRKPRF